MKHHPTNPQQFFLTAPQPCPYLQGQVERKVFTHLVGDRARGINDILTQGGFRRSQSIAYRPACEECQACVSVRVLVDEFAPGRTFRRTLRDNADLIGVERSASATSEQYSLFRRYLESRHSGGGMIEMSVLDYAMMVEDSHIRTNLVEYRRRGPDSAINGRGTGPLVAVCLADTLGDGLSMVYSFYDPALIHRGLGTFMILDHIRRARERRLPYLYLGYWVRGSDKMAYKGRFRPQEQLTPPGWERVE